MEEKNLTNETMWDDKRFHSLDYELKKQYGHKLYKLSLNGGMSCPNRDGTIDTRGCIFCSEGGSGDFAAPFGIAITEQIEEAKKRILPKIKNQEQLKYIAYFQAFTNTHAPVEYLKSIFTEAVMHPDIAILSIATRPDCLGDEILSLLEELNHRKPVWIELGLQTKHEHSADFIRRGYKLSVFETAVNRLHNLSISIIVHSILGLPRETKHDMLLTMEYLGKLPIQGIKLQLLHILKGTDLGMLFENGYIDDILTMEEYIDLVISCLELLPGNIVIHRITGDGPKKLLLAPKWSGNKKLVLNHIHQQMKSRNTWQGKNYPNDNRVI
ncbi:MAG: ytqA [Herbinix sp.]|jgi:radical SAM protein (TIGR01212 family)|nr:ytqA [Herbinix sp.]